MKKSLKTQVAELTAKFEAEEMVKSKLGNIKVLVIMRDTDISFISCYIEELEELKTIIKTFAPTKKESVVGTANDKFHTVMGTPYNLTINNPAQPNNFNDFSVCVKYVSAEFDVHIKLPIRFFMDHIVTANRPITDCEYHYFIGCSNKELRDIRVRQYLWNTQKRINWYGGDCTFTDAPIVNMIMFDLIK